MAAERAAGAGGGLATVSTLLEILHGAGSRVEEVHGETTVSTLLEILPLVWLVVVGF